jgi:hypothetical protein
MASVSDEKIPLVSLSKVRTASWKYLHPGFSMSERKTRPLP